MPRGASRASRKGKGAKSFLPAGAKAKKQITNLGRSKVHLEKLTQDLQVYVDGEAPAGGKAAQTSFYK